jgi:hypothetical protein
VANSIKLKVTNNRGPIRLSNTNFAYVSVPTSTPTVITSAIADLSSYSNTQAMLGNVATAYTNAVAYTENRLTSYTNSASLEVSSLNDLVTAGASNNATLVYDSASNKYVVKQIDLDGGNF